MKIVLIILGVIILILTVFYYKRALRKKRKLYNNELKFEDLCNSIFDEELSETDTIKSDQTETLVVNSKNPTKKINSPSKINITSNNPSALTQKTEEPNIPEIKEIAKEINENKEIFPSIKDNNQNELPTNNENKQPEISDSLKKIKEKKIIQLFDIPNPKIIEEIEIKEEESTHVKYIGYDPINIFQQSPPDYYPCVKMPKPKSIIKFPRNGRQKRKGYKEEAFKEYIVKYFSHLSKISDTQFVLAKNKNSIEPDLILIDEKNGINIFLDIEIDEPYEGTNDINTRKPTHYKFIDSNRDNSLINRGWIVIRFAEIQVHQVPDSCCQFIADVLISINPNFSYPLILRNVEKIKQVKLWSKEDALKMSANKYREQYLGIERFGKTEEPELNQNIDETELGEEIEDEVVDDNIETIDYASGTTLNAINTAINTNKYLSFNYKSKTLIVEPLEIKGKELSAYCYIRNKEDAFAIDELNNIIIKDSYYTIKLTGPTIGLEQIKKYVNIAIRHNKHIRMEYTRSPWIQRFVNKETGEYKINRIEKERSIRTISNVHESINYLTKEHIETYNLNSNHITAYCNKREEERTFRYNRISQIEILNI